MRNNKGVTMIALVLTISVLLVILAVTLSSVVGDQSILKRAEQAMELSELKDLQDMWQAKIVDIDEEKLNFNRLEDVLPEEQIPTRYRGKLAVKKGRIIYREDAGLTEEEKAHLLSVGVTKEFINEIDIKISAAIGLGYDTKPIDLVLVVDGSSHMDEEIGDVYKFKALTDALNTIIAQTMEHPLSRVSVVEYSEVSKVLLPLNHYSLAEGETQYFIPVSSIPANGDAYATINSTIKITGTNVAPTGTSNYTRDENKYQGLQLGVARGELIFTGRTESAEDLEERVDVMVILGNSVPNKAHTTATYANINNIANNNGLTDYSGIFGGDWAKNNQAPYYTYRFIQDIKANHTDLDLYTVSFATTDHATINKDDDNYVTTNFVLNPTNANYNNVFDAKDKWWLIVTTRNNAQSLYESLGEKNKTEIGTLTSYAENAYTDITTPSSSSSTGLADAFKDIFEKTKVDLGPIPDTEFEVISTDDKVIVNERLINVDKLTNERVTYRADDVHTDRKVKIKITPAKYNATTGTEMAVGNPTIKEYTYAELNAGLINPDDPEIVCDGFDITWDIQTDFDATASAERNIRKVTLENSGLTAGDGVIDIKSVEIVIPVYEESRVPLN